MTSFEDLGIREPLLRVLEEEELEAPTALQEAVVPVLRRGGNLVARASSGAGKTLAYGLGVLDRPRAGTDVAPEGEDAGAGAAPIGPRVLVLVPAAEAAEHVAGALFPYAQAVELTVTAADAAWATRPAEAGVVVSTPAALLEAVRGSSLKLDGVDAVVIDDAAAIHALGAWESVDTLLDLVPREAQRVVISATLPDAVEDLIERRVKRALHYPPAPAVAEGVPTPAEGEIGYVLVSEREKVEILARLLRSRQAGSAVPVLFCRTDERAAELAGALTMRGFLVGELDDADADAVVVSVGTTRAELMEETGEETGATISFDVPADEATLRARHAGDAAAVVLVEPKQLAHLREMARRAGLTARPMPVPVETTDFARGIDAFRVQLARAVRERDLGAQMLVLEPLFEEFGAAEVAAAAAALLRERQPAPVAETAAARPAAAAAASAPDAVPAAAATRAPVQAGPPPATWARLYVGVGHRDAVRPGDLVGAIAGESGIPGSKVGRIDIRDTFSIVEVQADVAETVIRAVNGTTIKGRSVRVDYDRGGDRSRRSEGGPPRRQQRERPEGGARPPVRRLPPRE